MGSSFPPPPRVVAFDLSEYRRTSDVIGKLFLSCFSFFNMAHSFENIYEVNAVLTKREVKMAGYWPNFLFAFL